MAETLVLGLGNILLSDEGAGVAAVRRLQELLEPAPSLTLLDGGTLGIVLLPYLEDASRLLILDCMRAGGEPGSLYLLEGEAATAWRTDTGMAHDFALPSVLALARLRGWQPEEVVVIGIEPCSLDTGVGLSAEVEAALPEACRQALCVLARWGHRAEYGARGRAHSSTTAEESAPPGAAG